jgi:hypothetical protein
MAPKLNPVFPARLPVPGPKEFSMIQLANDPNASRSFRPGQGEAEGKTSSFEAKRARSAHAWPFPSRYAIRPARQESEKPNARESGS